MFRTIWKLVRCQRGLAAVEFAVSAPVLILLYLGTFQVTDAMTTKRKVSITTRAIADLTTQYSSLTTTDADAVLAATTQIMAPYDASPGRYLISEIYIDAGGVAKVIWSRARNGTARAKDSSITVPSGIAQNDSYVILAETSYNYTTNYTAGLIPSVTMTDSIYMYPRLSTQIPLK
ncbi:TadE/TadG family type IV pilus assembly protein [Sphingobium vermicomposti]|uniref:Flp pilus assembly protein TadG n=1 Tax=Sphingobium vermicomposti TaxID=529005 RepID=A0A846M2R3_9SPHN|nr:TadE/TadG family type IV pilus assembly protein [Sphingobium vermicomposti]NIJ16457.1 Flp pilus assembly protein TadG [Sphingobium vermicomposti]